MRKPLFFDPANRLALACFEASRAWFDGEKSCAEAVQKNCELPREKFKDFLSIWGLARTAPKNRRDELAPKLAQIRIEDPSDLGSEAFSSFVEKLYEDRLTTGRPYSMVSKYLFCKNPLKFSPYDRYARRALYERGELTRDAGYVAFLKAFESFHTDVSEDLKKASLTRDMFAIDDKQFDTEREFSRRVADKYLMLLGGFGEYRMAAEVNKAKCRFPSETVSRFS
ncbi:hypothetical protein [Ruegeria atlantica]|uniref:hypothetical protein n=1 Tax=Ruegeria atlantica TaxID=81569 RepID=UPI00147E9B43|nr:hypothetical protein [Ruegeria atlantica]